MAVTIAVTATLALVGGATASAESDPSEAIANSTSKASNSSDPIVDAVQSGAGTLSATTPSGEVVVKSDAGGSVSVRSHDGKVVVIGLPVENKTAAANESSDGTITFAGLAGSADAAVQILSDGVRIATVIGSRSESTRYTYPLSPDLEPIVEGDGSVTLLRRVSVVDPESQTTISGSIVAATIARPWARDAAGKDVQTWYEVERHSLVQIVKHRGQGLRYPIVADPTLTYAFPNQNIWFNRAETATLASGGWSAAAITGICTVAGGPVLGGACLLAAGSIVYTAGVAQNSNPKKCVTVRVTNLVVVTYPSVYVYSNSYCR